MSIFTTVKITSISHFVMKNQGKTCSLEAVLPNEKKVVLEIANPELQQFFKVAEKVVHKDDLLSGFEMNLELTDLIEIDNVSTGKVLSLD
jgi:hypothetical protein